MFLLRISETSGGLFFAAYTFGWLIAVLIASFLHAPILRLSADLVVKRMPRLTTAFYISFVCSAMFFGGSAFTLHLGQPRGGSVLSGGSTAPAIDSPLIYLAPFVFLFVGVWIFSAKCFTDDESKAVGLARGLIVAAVNTALTAIVGALLFLVLAYST